MSKPKDVPKEVKEKQTQPSRQEMDELTRKIESLEKQVFEMQRTLQQLNQWHVTLANQFTLHHHSPTGAPSLNIAALQARQQ